MKTIDIAMIGWPRTTERIAYMQQTLRSIREKVTASKHNIVLRVSLETVDVSPDAFQKTREICAEVDAIPHWRAKQPSLGGNMNDALMLGFGDFKLLTQDDWPWIEEADLSRDCEFLEIFPAVAMIRYATFYTEFVSPAEEGVRSIELVNMTGPYPYGDQPHLRRGDFATRKSVTGGEPIGFYQSPSYMTGPNNYATPENKMAEHLAKQGWQIAAYRPNLTSHNGCLSTNPERHPDPLLNVRAIGA